MAILVPLYAALIAVGTFIRIDISIYPVTLQTLFVMLLAVTTHPLEALLSVALYLLMGLVGLPVFTTGGSIAAFLAPSGGFLISFLIVTPLGAWIAKRGKSSPIPVVISLLTMEILMYVIGIPYMIWRTGLPLSRALALGLLPYLPGDTIKASVVAISYRPILRLIERLRTHLARRRKIENEDA